MGPVTQKSIQRTVSLFICVCIALCTIVARNIAQNRPDNFLSYPGEMTGMARWCGWGWWDDGDGEFDAEGEISLQFDFQLLGERD